MTLREAAHDAAERLRVLEARLASGLLWETGARGVVQLLSWVSTLLVARWLVPADYGLVATAGVFIGLVQAVADFGLGPGLVSAQALSAVQERTAYVTSLTLGVLGAAALIVASAPIATLYESDQLTLLIRVASITLILGGARTLSVARVTRELDFRFRALADTAGQLVGAVISIWLAAIGAGAWSLILAHLTSQALLTTIYLARRPPPLGTELRLSEIRGIASFGGTVTLARILEVANERMPAFFLGIYHSQSAAGNYSFGGMLAGLPLSKIGSIFNRIGFPVIAQAKSNQEHARLVIKRLHRLLMLLGIPILCIIGVSARDLIPLVFGRQWEGAVMIAQILCAVNVVRLGSMMMPYASEGLGIPRWSLGYQITNLVITGISFGIAAKSSVALGVATFALLTPIQYLTATIPVCRRIGISLGSLLDSIRDVTISAACAVAVALAASVALVAGVGRLSLTVVTFAVTCLLLLLAQSHHQFKSELRQLWRLLRNKAAVDEQ